MCLEHFLHHRRLVQNDIPMNPPVPPNPPMSPPKNPVVQNAGIALPPNPPMPPPPNPCVQNEDLDTGNMLLEKAWH